MRPTARIFAACAALWVAGCQPDIGDPCVSSIDCSVQGDRLCDTSQPEGYCTAFNCEPDKCPENSVCVGFGLDLDPSCTSEAVDPRWPRFERTFCLKACESNDDCREQYECVSPTDRRAESIDVESDVRSSKVCFRATGVVPDPESPACP